ncbi:MAG: hypothetical protein GC136_09525 [Alphaproteobacteria bacterium]|nr:hypothetical protein [Alphaproteobacteria bacterium]
MELQNEFTADSDDAATDGYNDMFFRTEVAPTVRLNDYFFIDGVGVLERMQDRRPAENNWFDNEGVFVEELKLNYESGAWALMAGKFNPAFGMAWDFGRGIWSEDFAEDYEITERIGVGAAYSIDTQNAGTYTLTASTFFADTTFLSGSTITSRGRTDKSDGGIANTEDFSSYVVSLEGENAGGVENLYYQLAWRDQAPGDVDIGAERERGVAVTLGYIFKISERIESDMLLEYADISDFEGGADDRQYYTASFVNRFNENWNVTLGYTARNIDTPAGDSNDYLLQASGGYDFGQGTTAEIGWRSTEESGANTDIIGGLIRHTLSF